jgi:uncharacterized RDD family membrane protein YckC
MDWCRACGGRLTADEDLCPWCRAPNPTSTTRLRDRFPDPLPHQLDDSEGDLHERDEGPAFALPRRTTRPSAMAPAPEELRRRDTAAAPIPAGPRSNAEPPRRPVEARPRALEWHASGSHSDDPRDRAWVLEEETAEGAAISAALPHAPFLPRSAAFVIDLLILLLMNGAVFVVALAAVGLARALRGGGGDSAHLFGALFTAGQVGLVFGYFGVLHAGPGQTIGKALLRIRVIGLDGGELALRQSMLRAGAYVFSALPLCLGFLLAAFPPWRALHDYLVGSRVVRIGAS